MGSSSDRIPSEKGNYFVFVREDEKDVKKASTIKSVTS